ncbi:MAG: DUF3795 domain-containing protein [Bacteroidales bacterium]|jgi:hypothetical protein|nr:DUF3795 domain-containing protein [Bacteroidales bacterium]
MEKIISSCGLNCTACDARIATIANNNELRAQVAEKWKVQYGANGITPAMINCVGCRETGIRFPHCEKCKIRNCAISNGYITCAECEKMENCDIVKNVHQYAPEALENLKSLQ